MDNEDSEYSVNISSEGTIIAKIFNILHISNAISQYGEDCTSDPS